MSSQQKMSSEMGAAEQYEMEQLADAETNRLLKLIRTLRIERETFLDSKNKALRKFRANIRLLEREKQQLQLQLDCEENGVHSKRETELESVLESTYEKQEKANHHLKAKKDALWELEGHIKKIHREIAEIRRNEVTDIRYNETIAKAQRSVRKLENRLDVVNKKAGVAMAENAQLRQTIDHMLTERATFNIMWEKLVGKLNEGKRYMMDLIDQATSAYDTREELCTKLQILKDKGQSEKIGHIQEMRELQRKLDHDAKLQEFLGIKGQRRSNAELEEREAQKRLKMLENLEKQYTEYEQIMTRIMAFSGEDDIDRLVAKFIKKEEENFALFNYVNELSHEVETLTESVQILQDKITEQIAINESKEHSQDDNIDALRQEEQNCKQNADAAFEIKQVWDVKLDELLRTAERIYKLLHCDEAPILNLLNNESNVTLNNAKLFLGIIERRVANMISNVNYVEPTTKILGKKDRVPNFNVKESAKIRIERG
ncbi:coiled-coil domain-containing protein 63 [Toxorhynchites rutilus septentrionalis]|uniref:coiled-coil domain-containing protein 63 n=1 Tax=Toxorhynchites rutilus septentrionalis TaxID=329112 RepID=UPI00247B0D8D|nr:coiled-coil domain-containing protein 63 [Toxorhynchites rutilus septentrionalis]XP_055640310.1 coiled-coil domain-containing protein 63 [Toxorhynchites rutilus septentrionalis]